MIKGGNILRVALACSLMAAAGVAMAEDEAGDEGTDEAFPPAGSEGWPEQKPPPEAAPPAETPAAQGQATLRFRNEVGGGYKLTEARFVLDGVPLSTVLRAAERDMEYVVFAGALSPGRHVVTAHLTYQGERRGVVTYMKYYTLKLSADQVLTAPRDRAVTFTIVGRENKGMNVPLERRLSVTVDQR